MILYNIIGVLPPVDKPSKIVLTVAANEDFKGEPRCLRLRVIAVVEARHGHTLLEQGSMARGSMA